MLDLSSILTPIAGELGIGGIGGFFAGWALKKAAKLVAAIIGLSFLGLQYLAYQNVIDINYDALTAWASDVAGMAAGSESLVIDFIAHAPFGAAFIGGFYLGIQKG